MALSDSQCERRRDTCKDSLREETIDALAGRARQGDAKAFDALACRLRPRLMIVLVKHLEGRHSDAEDVAQTALTTAWQKIERYDPSRPFLAWVYTIALRQATDVLRRRSRIERQLVAMEDYAQSVEPAEPGESVSNVWATAKRVLSSTHYSALWLRYGEELSVEEVAVTIGKSKIATRVLLHRARRRLQSSLQATIRDQHD